MTRYRSPVRTPQEWLQIIQEFDSSGLSPSEFCQLHIPTSVTPAWIAELLREVAK